MIFESIKMVFKIFKTNKLRTFLTMIGMIIGVVSVVIILSISNAAKESVAQDLESLNNSIINVSFMESEKNIYSLLPENLSEEFLENSSIEYIAKRIEFEWKELNEIKNIEDIELESDLYYDDMYEDYSYTICEGVSLKYFDIYSKLKDKLLYGRMFNKTDEDNKLPVCIIREDVAEEFLESNECIGEKILINNQEVKIIGVMQNNESEYDYPYVSDVYLLADYLSSCNDNINIVNKQYIVKPISINAREEAISNIKSVLNEYISTDDYFLDEYYISSEDVSTQILDLITIVFIGIAGISLLVGGIGIMNILLVSVNERIKEIGIRRAVGATKNSIMLQFLIESIAITIMSGIISIILAVVITNLLNQVLVSYGLNLLINFEIILKVMLVCGLIGIIFGIYPSVKASKLNPVDALRYE